MADVAGGGADVAPTFKRSRLKPEIYKTTDGRVIVEDELLNFLAVKIKSLIQDEIVLLATNTFNPRGLKPPRKFCLSSAPLPHSGALDIKDSIKTPTILNSVLKC